MSDDLIKRSDAIEAYSDIYWIDDRLNLAFREELDKIDEKIRNIPIVEVADRPQGKWIEDPINKNNMYCSNCKVSYTKDFLRGMSLYHEPKDMPNYCPNCGARMKGVEDE